ncbi:MarR family winged helix-turn-helix transcriptional regulator [Novosphingobium sp. TH158]|uniref:MarR family winged helix-turn-helix transcriptional regulator n=1 Tax=Novosphingobium sp. TH158 TaxID=2067455 RepID=UPI000C7A4931|nr:MarR family winged helix-turn-helix transcriptional regulator [Novosphingobium sp. TH158]PLK24223.1 hypothetical protein C0V78_13165 [Novosphingobium sp. TH158]
MSQTKPSDDEFFHALQRMVDEAVKNAMGSNTSPDALLIEGAQQAGRPAVLGSSRYLDWAQRIYAVRRSRRQQLPPELFGEPSWDILLDLYIAFYECRKVSINGACVAADVPQTTALRHLQQLEAQGLVHRVDDLRDKRIKWVGLTQKAILAIGKICDADFNSSARRRQRREREAGQKAMQSVFNWEST